jgi:integrase
MPRPRPPYLNRERTRHGKFKWYVRKQDANKLGPRIRIFAEFGTPEFEAEYRAAISGAAVQPVAAPRKSLGSLAWLWDRYRNTSEWKALGHTTRRARENVMAHVMAKSGHEPCADIGAVDILAGRDARKQTPSQAKCFLVVMRAMYRFALVAGYVTEDPTVGIKAFPKKKGGTGFPIWTEEEVERYQAYYPIGTRQRVWIDLLLYTGLRRGDLVTIGRQHVSKGVATLRTEKSQGEMTVTLPILPILAATLAAGPCAPLAFICGARGEPLKKACDAAGVVGKSAHGIRKAAATRCADNGATEQQLNAIFGWEPGSGMAALYTKTADRKRASMRAMAMMERTTEEQSIPAPMLQVRGASLKGN